MSPTTNPSESMFATDQLLRTASERPPDDHGATIQVLRFGVLMERELGLLSERGAISLSSVYLATFAILLSRYNNLPELTIALASSGRPDGMFSTTGEDHHGQIISINCAPERTVWEFLRAIGSEAQNRDEKPPADDTGFCRAAFLWEDVPGTECDPLSDEHIPSVIEKFDVSLRVRSSEEGAEATLLYKSNLFERAMIERMSRHLNRLFEQIANHTEVSIAELDMMPAEERALVLGAYAGSSSDYPQACVHQLFAEQLVLRADAEAVVYGQERLTYRELDQRSNQVARYLASLGIKPEEPVGVFMDRSNNMIVSILGIVKAGGAYVPIDIQHPTRQVKFIIEDTAMRWVLTQHSIEGSLPASVSAICMDAANTPIHACSQEPVVNLVTPESIAVVIYTSGSTGLPKAARVPHRAVVRTVRNTNYLQVLAEDRVAQAGSPSFDASIQEIWLALLNGATLVGIRPEALLTPAELTHLVENEGISILILNTSYVHQIARDCPTALKGIRKVIFGGEAAEPEPLRRLLKHVGPNVLVNGYGPAEGCVITTYHEITEIPDEAITVPIGRPVSNAQVYLLDILQRPVPIGVPGELYIGGEGVARGYLRRPDLTAQRFISDPFGGKPERLLYRTGDFARMRGDGQLEFLGRTDEQIKLRGHRIELAEVRHAIVSHPDIKQVFLMVREDVPGDRRLVAYATLHRVVPTAQEGLRKHTVDRLPAHMVPAAFVVLESIPLNTNGKVDRRALPAPNERLESKDSYQAPENHLEHTLTLIWQQLLRLDQVGVNDNFFDLGGHSLLAARLIARIEKHTGINIPVATLFDAPTIAQLAARLRHSTYASAWSPLVELHVPQTATTAKPFFCVHSLGANLVSFHKIATFLRTDRAIYGLQPHGLDGKQEPLDSIEAMASAYVSEIHKKQARGPYYLGGVCLGGVVAYEMAQQLRAVGEEVALLALIDSYMPGELEYLRTRTPLSEYLDRHLGEMFLLPIVSRFRYMARWMFNGCIRFGRAIGVREHSSIANATRKITKAHHRAIVAYKPKSYGGKIVQLLCGEASHRAYEDRRLAWSSLAHEGFEVRVIPGNHLTMVEEPHAQVVAQELQRCLDRVTDRPTSRFFYRLKEEAIDQTTEAA